VRVGGKQQNCEEMFMSQTALIPGFEPLILEPSVVPASFNGARLLQPIPYQTIHGVPIHVYAQKHPCPITSYPSGEQDWVDVSLRSWVKSTKTRTSDQNYLCEYRYNRYIHCKGVILSAAQTATVWQMEPSKVCERDEVPKSFRLDEDVQAEVDAARDAVRKLVAEYENDWQTQAEQEQLLRSHIKKAQLHNDLIHDSPAIMCGKLAQPPEELENSWNAELRKYDLPPEMDFYPPQFVHKTYDGRERSRNDEDDRDAGFEADGISYDGMRETQGDRPNDHQERKHWFPWFRGVLNEEGWTAVKWVPEGFTAIGGWTPEREAEIRNHPKFPALVALYQVLFSGRSIDELDIDKDSDTTAKLLARAKEIKGPLDSIPESDWQKAIGHYACTVVLNNRGTLKILAPLDGPVADAVTALNKERQKVRRKAIDNAKQDAKARGLGKKAAKALIAERVKRIDQAYDEVLIMEHRGITINDLDDVTPAEVIFSAISRGQPQH
jgi:hypothetical protein